MGNCSPLALQSNEINFDSFNSGNTVVDWPCGGSCFFTFTQDKNFSGMVTCKV